MSRVAKQPIQLPSNVEVVINDKVITAKGPKGSLEDKLHSTVKVSIVDKVISVEALDSSKESRAMSGTTRSLINNMVIGVDKGFEKKLTLIGVGYRAQLKGKVLNLTLGFSHPVNYEFPEDIIIEVPSQTEVVVKGANKQKVGQTAAEIRAFRPPEPYKGKGVRYSDEHVVIKEAKKK